MEVICKKSDAILNLPSFDSTKRYYHSDGRRRSCPKASTVRGWLVKWRATFSGNERLRKEGIREMREAKAVREYRAKKRAAQPAKAGASKPFFCLWPILLGKKCQPQVPKGPSHVSQHSSTKHLGHEGTQHQASPSHSPRPTSANPEVAVQSCTVGTAGHSATIRYPLIRPPQYSSTALQYHPSPVQRLQAPSQHVTSHHGDTVLQYHPSPVQRLQAPSQDVTKCHSNTVLQYCPS